MTVYRRGLSALALSLVLVSVVQGNEWSTSRDQHCIERCEVKEKLGKEAYACYTVDGVNKEFRSSNGSFGISGRPSVNGPIPALDDDEFPWDFCTPAKSISLEQNDDPNSEPLPRPINNTNQQGFNPGNKGEGGSGFNAGSSEVSTSLPGVPCIGPCMIQQSAYKCSYEGVMADFYCSPDIPLVRQQVTSHNKLWCIDRCEKINNGEYMCRTLVGKDSCSPNPKFSTKGTQCLTACSVWPESGHNYLACRISESIFEQCGDWDIVQEKAKALEYTNDHKVCAGPCSDHDGEWLCSYAQWKTEGSKEDGKALLYMMEGECGEKTAMNWTLIGIILGCVVGAIILIAVAGIVVSKRSGYNRAATNDRH